MTSQCFINGKAVEIEQINQLFHRNGLPMGNRWKLAQLKRLIYILLLSVSTLLSPIAELLFSYGG